MPKIAKVRTRKRGKSYAYAFEAGKSIDRKRKVIEKGGFSTEKAAYEAGLKAYNDFKFGCAVISMEAMSVAEFLTNWLAHISKEIKFTTAASYRAFIQQSLPFIGDTLMCDLTPLKCESWLKQLQKNKGYAPSSILRIRGCLNEALNYAVYPCQVIKTNPLQGIQLKQKRKSVVPRIIISPEKLGMLLKRYPYGTADHIIFQIAYHTGMRISEILGLTFNDIDFAKQTIHIRRQCQLKRGAGSILSDTLKTKQSYREVPIDSALCSLLQSYKNDTELNQLISPDDYTVYYTDTDDSIVACSASSLPANQTPIDFVCISDTGKRTSSTTVGKHLREFGLNSHSFRHTHATMLLEAGASLKGISARLGHSGSMLTQRLYIHNTDQIQQDTLSKFEEAMLHWQS